MAHTFQNLSFEDAKSGSLKTLDENEFEPDGWTVVEVATAQEVVRQTNTDYLLTTETFEIDWGNNDFLFEFVGVAFDLEAAVFDAGPTPTTVETFERFWSSNESFLFELGRTEVAAFGSSDEHFDGFESEWGNDGFVFVFDPSDLEAASSVPENFESGWDNDSYLFEFTSPGTQLEAAVFASLDEFEDFLATTTEYYLMVWVIMSGTSDATYRVTVNGEVVEYVAQSENANAIRAALKTRIDNLSVPTKTLETATTGLLWIGLTDPESELLVRLDLENATAGEQFVKLTIHDYYKQWDQSGAMTTI